MEIPGSFKKEIALSKSLPKLGYSDDLLKQRFNISSRGRLISACNNCTMLYGDGVYSYDLSLLPMMDLGF